MNKQIECQFVRYESDVAVISITHFGNGDLYTSTTGFVSLEQIKEAEEAMGEEIDGFRCSGWM